MGSRWGRRFRNGRSLCRFHKDLQAFGHSLQMLPSTPVELVESRDRLVRTRYRVYTSLRLQLSSLRLE